MNRRSLVGMVVCLGGLLLVPACNSKPDIELHEQNSVQQPGKEPEHGFLGCVYKAPDGQEYKYALFVPYSDKGDKPFPLIVFLHGSGEAGKDGKKETTVGIGPAVKKQEQTFPFLVLFPQSRDPDWEDADDKNRVIAELDEVEKEYKIDPKRVYLTGLSSGGDAVWALAAEYPDRWAAIIPIVGEGNPADAAKIKDIPCWAFEGGRDDKETVDSNHAMIQALKDAGGDPKYTEFPDLNHMCWDRAYNDPQVMDWLGQQHRK
ncbi:MAG: dienelactone hydrolase family protein [Planctomycetes bacterium]|nr:dienelactone hydrolase family protein [Planctomycetota bacterium]